MNPRAGDKLARGLGVLAREARTQAGLTQKDVAGELDLAGQVYGRLERGEMRPSIETLRRLCVTLRLSADELLALGQEPRPPQDGPELRRLMRRLRMLSPASVRVVAKLVEGMTPEKRKRRRRRS